MSWCDPCAADPLSQSELRELGVHWLGNASAPRPNESFTPPRRTLRPQAQNVFVTRLHLRYDAKTFPEDLKFQTTGDRTNYQGRYVLRHAWRGDYGKCEAAGTYANGLVDRWDKEAKTLASLTGRDINDIRERMKEEGMSAAALNLGDIKPTKWWENLWGNRDG